MTGWEIDDLLSALKAAIKENDSALKQFCSAYHPLCSMAKETLVILRQFNVVVWQDERRVMNAQPQQNDEQQWGITVVEHDGSSGSMFSACIPNNFSYSRITLDDSGQIVITADDRDIVTNISELSDKLKPIYGLATEAEIAAAFDSLSDEHYEPPEKLEVVYQTLTDATLGTLLYNESSENYQTTWHLDDKAVSIYVELTEPERLEPLVKEVAKKLSSRYYLQAMQAMLIPMLTLKNDSWLGEDEQGNAEPALTVEEFNQRITISAIEFYADGNSVIYCDDGDLFFGHSIVIDVDKDGEFIDANIAG